MPTDAVGSLTIPQRRRARRLACWNAALWGTGNGLCSTTLVVYLAIALGVPRVGLSISLILAARHLVGVLRLGAPAMIGRLAERKRFCLGTYLASGLLLFGLPLVAAPGVLPSPGASLVALVAIWCAYHVLEYVGSIALWSWLADLVPLRIRGRFLGVRERWMVAGQAAAMLSGGLSVWGWQRLHARPLWWVGYAIAAAVGAWLILASLVPLALMPRVGTARAPQRRLPLRALAAPFADRRFLRLLAFGCWFSFSNAITQSVQLSYPAQVLGIGLFSMLALQTAMRVGQWGISPGLGRLADRIGNRPVMIASLLLTAQGPLLYLVSTPQQPWWFAGAWILWIAYAGLNIALPNLMLKLAPRGSNTPYIAAYFTVTGLCYAANTILGGLLFDRYQDHTWQLLGGTTLDYSQGVFLVGWIARSLGLLALLAVVEPAGGEPGT